MLVESTVVDRGPRRFPKLRPHNKNPSQLDDEVLEQIRALCGAGALDPERVCAAVLFVLLLRACPEKIDPKAAEEFLGRLFPAEIAKQLGLVDSAHDDRSSDAADDGENRSSGAAEMIVDVVDVAKRPENMMMISEPPEGGGLTMLAEKSYEEEGRPESSEDEDSGIGDDGMEDEMAASENGSGEKGESSLPNHMDSPFISQSHSKSPGGLLCEWENGVQVWFLPSPSHTGLSEKKVKELETLVGWGWRKLCQAGKMPVGKRAQELGRAPIVRERDGRMTAGDKKPALAPLARERDGRTNAEEEIKDDPATNWDNKKVLAPPVKEQQASNSRPADHARQEQDAPPITAGGHCNDGTVLSTPQKAQKRPPPFSVSGPAKRTKFNQKQFPPPPILTTHQLLKEVERLALRGLDLWTKSEIRMSGMDGLGIRHGRALCGQSPVSVKQKK